MNTANRTVTIIIPTHNRAPSTKRLLDKLAQQTYPLTLMEVVVVANSCTDDTVDMLKSYEASYKFQYAETAGNGPAVARNKGATLATGEILIFLDDDIDPSPGLVEGHVSGHTNEKTVVVGYLPFPLPPKPGFFKINLRFWWENKFSQMNTAGYRFSYEDLLSGNFSISASFFKEIEGFIIGYSCRDDYELGIRLIQAGAEIRFSRQAWGYHRDEVTDLKRSLKRKKEEGKTDVKIWRLYPDIRHPMQYAGAVRKNKLLRLKPFFFLLNFTKFFDALASNGIYVLNFFERLKLRRGWQSLSARLHTYWYLRGLQDELGSTKNLIEFLTVSPPKNEAVDIDLSEGINNAEKALDDLRPSAIKIYYNQELIGTVAYKLGAEPLKGAHLKRILLTEMSVPVLKAMSFQTLLNKAV